MAVILLTVSLGLVGYALDAAFRRSSEAALQARMESLVYLVLAATEVADDGTLIVDEDPGDPRLGQPASGFFAMVNGQGQRWTSASSMGVNLPAPLPVQAGESGFVMASDAEDLYIFRYGVSWELAESRLIPLTVTIMVDPQELQPALRAFRNGLWRSLGAAGLILLLAQIVLLGLGLRPLRRITEDISGVESGAIRRLDGDYARELEPLKRNLNRLLDTEEANQTRYRNALDSLAHSLKTPLSVIRSSLPSEPSPGSAVLEDAVMDMQRLITTRLQRAAVTTRRSIAKPVAVKTQVERVINSLRRVYSQKMIKTDVIIKPGTEFYGEQRDLLELLGNLLDNAFKYGDGQIRLTSNASDIEKPSDGFNLVVEDNGPGIAKGEQQRLLERGVRGDEQAEGHGLGLAIVMEIVSAYHGEITIKRSDLGGACVSVWLRTG